MISHHPYRILWGKLTRIGMGAVVVWSQLVALKLENHRKVWVFRYSLTIYRLLSNILFKGLKLRDILRGDF